MAVAIVQDTAVSVADQGITVVDQSIAVIDQGIEVVVVSQDIINSGLAAAVLGIAADQDIVAAVAGLGIIEGASGLGTQVVDDWPDLWVATASQGTAIVRDIEVAIDRNIEVATGQDTAGAAGQGIVEATGQDTEGVVNLDTIKLEAVVQGTQARPEAAQIPSLVLSRQPEQD